VLGIELTPARRAEIANLDAEQLDALLAQLRNTRNWA